MTQKDQYPIPLVDKLMKQLDNIKVYIKLDIQQGFHQLHLDPEMSDLTTFKTQYGTYKYHMLPFKLINRPAAFQQLINETLGMDYLDNFITAFINNLIIYSKNTAKHKQHVKIVLKQL